MTDLLFRDIILNTKDGDWGSEEPAVDCVPYSVIRGTDFDAVRRGGSDGVPTRYLRESTVHRRTLQAGDILIETAGGSRDRPTGRTLFVSDQVINLFDLPVTCASFARFLRVNRECALPEYVYWYLQDMYNRGAMWEHQVQHTGVARFQFTRFAETVRMRIPGKGTQRAIAAVLGALDDKIAVNERIAAVADKLMRAEYGVSSQTGSRRRIGDLSVQVRNQVEPTNLDPAYPYIGLEHLPRRLAWLRSWGRVADIASAKSRFAEGDVLFGKLRPYFHKVVLAPVAGVCSTDILVVRAKDARLRSLVLAALSSDEVIAYATARGEGTRMPRISWNDLACFEALWPEDTLANAFAAKFTPIIGRVQGALHENDLLMTLRDTLLPNLMSGELRIRDAEKIVEDAV
jgi:type I restriction enzyme, S subunit